MMSKLTHVRASKIISLLLLVLPLGLATIAAAQSDETVVAITEVQSQDYPRVSLFLTVTGSDGPVENLQADDFEIFEDNATTPLAPVAAEGVSLEGLRLVVALDTSMPDADLDVVKNAATELVSTLSPKDKAAIITFGSQASLAHDFTNNTNELQAVIEAITPQGNQTALHEAMIEASNLLADVSEGYRAALFITDSRDNTGKQSVTQAVSRAQAGRLPLYVAGFGDKVQGTHPLKDEVALTGGQYFTMPAAEELPSTVEAIETRLRQGYQVTFESAFTADNTEHDVTIVVNHPDGEGQAEGVFVAIANPIEVILPDISEGNMLAGNVTLNPEITAPASFESITYLLDDQVLATFTEPPYTLEWDTSTAEAGHHTLVIKAVDTVGNEGQVEVPITVAAPAAVDISSTKERVEIGDLVAFQTAVTATAQVATVELLLNNELVASKSEPPYRFSFDSTGYPPGNYIFVVRVEDSLGQVTQDSLNLAFVPPPPPPPPLWQRIWNDQRLWSSLTLILAMVAFTSVGLIAILLLILVDSTFRKRSRRRCQLEIINTGNIQSRYRLRAKEELNALKFEFFAGKNLLPPLMVTRPAPATTVPGAVMPAAVPAAPPLQASARQPAPAAPPAAPAQAKSRGGAKQALGKVESAQSQAYGCSYMITEILETLGSILPGSAGASVRRASGQIHKGQMVADRAVRAPTQTARSVQHLQYQVAEAVPAGSQSATTPAGAGGGYAAPAASPQAAGSGAAYGSGVAYGPISTGGVYASQPQPGYVSAPVGNGVGNGAQKAAGNWVQTPFVEPGDSLKLDLLITPDKPFKNKSYDFTLSSAAIDQTETPVDEQGTAKIKAVFWLWRFLLILIILLVTALFMYTVVWLAAWRLFYINMLDYLNIVWIWLPDTFFL